MNTGVMFSSASDLWATPQDFFDALDSEFHFETDVCALPENAKCRNYYTPEMDGLKQTWTGVCWCNPPYGRKIGGWVKKAFESAKGGGDGRYAAACTDGYGVVSRLYLRQSRSSLCSWAVEVWWGAKRRAIPVYGCSF